MSRRTKRSYIHNPPAVASPIPVIQNQIIAAAITFVTLLILWLSDLLSRSLTGPASQIAQYVSITKRFEDMPRGVIDTKDVIFFVPTPRQGSLK